MKHAEEDDLVFYLRGEMSPAEAAPLTTHLKDCPMCSGRLAGTRFFLEQLALLGHKELPADGQGERRKSRRIPTDDPANVFLLQPDARTSSALPPEALLPEAAGVCSTRVLEVSSSGLKLRLSDAVAPGAMLRIQMKNTFILGEVRYCRKVGAAFDAGVQIRNAFPARRAPAFDN